MRIISIITAIVAFTISVSAQPLLVGHRGSIWGLENSSEAFINGAKKGYHYLETDVKVTKDGKHVCCHNDDLTTWGGTLTIASSTLEQLQAETLTQTRSGVTYTGHLCSLEEYLDICKEHNVKPLIELKWATGINSNDCSGIPALIKVIEDKGFRSTCIILTSMKPCLEYIRTNYSDIELQFLTGEYWANHFDWCVQWDIDVDIQAGYFSKSTVTQYHEKGLKVNMWTANDNASYQTYGNFGCDFITTDKLDSATLPDLNAEATLPPNVIDYPTMNGVIKESYTAQKVTSAATPTHLQGMTIRRALINNDKWYVLAHDTDKSPILSVVNAETGTEIKRMDLTGVEGGEVTLSDIAFTADGVLLGCNQAIVNYGGGGDVFKIYKWTSDDATPEVFTTIDNASYLGNWTNSYAGETFTVSGNLNELYVYVSTHSSSGTAFRIAGIQYSGATAGTYVYALDSSYNQENWGTDVKFSSTPFSRNNILVDSDIMNATEFTLNWEGTRIPMTEYSSLSADDIDTKATGIDFIRIGAKVYAYIADCDDTQANTSAALYDATSKLEAITSVSGSTTGNSSTEIVSYVNTQLEYSNNTLYLYLFTQGEGISKYAIEFEKDEVVRDVELTLELLWENSRTEGTLPQNIDGTNAQQGSAHKGLFYVNNCVDKKIYIFDKTGCLGSIEGGAGFGTACDDAGNIIVRNDKLSGTEHSFIIYPSGATVENPGTYVSIDVTVPLSGQTNFISASGDVLGDGGAIYLFPNGNNAVNIISLENGEVTGTRTSTTDLSITASTAGYVIPINNNTENWIYHVRANGFYMYNGGSSESLLTTKASTTAPARNSTGGGDYFTIGGHNILLHNSGANYRGGFAVRDMTDDKVIANIDPIGTLGYEEGGNYSTFNWLFAEKIDDNSYYIYQYCPANGMAVYRLYDKNSTSAIEETFTAETGKLSIYPNPATDAVNILADEEITAISLFNISGALLNTEAEINGNTARMNIEELPAGTYILRVNDKSAKLIKK